MGGYNGRFNLGVCWGGSAIATRLTCFRRPPGRRENRRLVAIEIGFRLRTLQDFALSHNAKTLLHQLYVATIFTKLKRVRCKSRNTAIPDYYTTRDGR
jgi:hypothetical protein